MKWYREKRNQLIRKMFREEQAKHPKLSRYEIAHKVLERQTEVRWWIDPDTIISIVSNPEYGKAKRETAA